MTMLEQHRVDTIDHRTEPLTVVGVTDTERDRGAIAWAMGECGTSEAVHLVHSYVPVRLPECSWPPVVAKTDGRRSSARHSLARVLQQTRSRYPGLQVTGSVVAGLPTDVLLEFSTVVDRVVVSEDREGGSLLHDVAHRLAGTARCAVIIMPPAFEPAAVAPAAPISVLIDSCGLPKHAVEFAYQEAQRRGVALCVAQIWSGWRETSPITAGLIAQRQQLLDEQLVSFERGPHPVGVVSQLIRDDFDSAVVELRRVSASLVVGSALERLARLTGPSAPGACPVIVVPELGQEWR